MMKTMLTLLALLAGFHLPAQVLEIDGTTTHAVVVGISDYQDAAIPDLRFADRDAEAFANFLRSPAGGSLDGDHLKLLTNKEATAGRIAEALDNLIEQVEEGDQVIIYFSGHGDVEGKKISQPGFLLCWDSPSRVYMGGGTYSLSFLQEVVTTLAVQNKAKVTVITDACHAGKLSGSQIGGAQLTSANLAKQYANEVKILSCQPNEFSLEGEQWGGGRGVFSYHLVDGLFGLADRNADGSVSVGEVDRYLEDKVTAEAAPQSQVPMLLGNKTERLATVNAGVLADLKKHKAGGMPTFAATESRGFEDEVLAKVDTSIREMYRAFKRAVQEKRFLEPAGNCAEDFYAKLVQVEALAPLHGIMKRNYAAALQDDSQQVMNNWLKSDLHATSLSKKRTADKFRHYPRYLERAAELLGKQHYMYPSLQARKLFFEGFLFTMYNKRLDKGVGDKALEIFREALQWQPDLPHAYWQISLVFAFNFEKTDSTEFYAQLAMELQPSWLIPPLDVAYVFSVKKKAADGALPYLEYATRIDSNSAEVLEQWGNYFDSKNQIPETEEYYKKAIRADSSYVLPYYNLGLTYFYAGRLSEAETFMKKIIQLDSTYDICYMLLGGIYALTNRPVEAELYSLKAIEIDPFSGVNHYGYACTLSHLNQLDKAYEKLEDALKIGDETFDYDWMQTDPDLVNVRAQTEKWKALMKKYFPNQFID